MAMFMNERGHLTRAQLLKLLMFLGETSSDIELKLDVLMKLP